MPEDAPPADTESQALRRTKRTIVVPERAKQEAAERAEKRAQHERHINKQKRKAFAEARDKSQAAADDESSDDGGSPKRARKAGRFDDSLLMQPYDQIANDVDREEWLLAAIYRRDGDDMRNSGLTREELEELWEEPSASPESRVDYYPGIKVDVVEHRMAEGRGATAQLPKLQPTDSTTISPGRPIIYRGARDPNGKLVPIDGGRAAGTSTRSSSGDGGDDGRKPVGASTAPKKLADRPATSSQVHGYADGFRVTPVPQPNRRAPVPQSSLRLSTHSSSQLGRDRDRIHSSSQPARDRVHSSSQPARDHVRSSSQPVPDRMRSLSQPAPSPKSPLSRRQNGPPPAPPSRRDPPSTPASPRASVPGSSRQLHASKGAPVVVSPTRSHPSTPAGAARHARASTHNRSSRPPVPHARGPSVPRRVPGPTVDNEIRAPASPAGDTDAEEERAAAFGQDELGGFGQDELGQNEQLFFDDDEDGPDPPDPGRPTQRQLAQLSCFGVAKRLVQELNRRIKLRAVLECAYADVLPCLSEPDENGERHELGSILDMWLPEEWAEVNKKMRPGLAPLPLLEAYCTYVKDDFSGVRNHVKTALLSLVPSQYGFVSGFSEDNITKSSDLLPDAFLSPDLVQPDPQKQFRHKIIAVGIKACWFNSRRAIGYVHAAKFRPMPVGVIAFVCTIIHYVISDFSSGEQQLAKLDAERQAPWFERYVDLLNDMGKAHNCPQRLENIQREAFDKAHGKYQAASNTKLQRPVLDYGPDSEEEYTYIS